MQQQAMGSVWRCASCATKRIKVACKRGLTTSRVHQRQVGVEELLRHEKEEEGVEVDGWVRSVRKQKQVAFVHLGDGSTSFPLQAVLKPEQAAK